MKIIDSIKYRLFEKNNYSHFHDYRNVITEFLKSYNITIEEAEEKLFVATDGKCLYFESEKKQQLEALYFAAFSIINNNVQNVLEIGTGLGWNTVILSSLYNQAKIYTYDLPVNDRDYSTLAWTQQDEYFLDKINKENILFKEKNSFFMMEDDLPDLDLIYVDGGHSYPSLAWDTMFAYHKTSPQGMIIFHDYDRPNNDPTRDANHVKDIIDGYLSELIQEKIHYLPWAETDGRARICIIQKN